jgi:hypothetical protein
MEAHATTRYKLVKSRYCVFFRKFYVEISTMKVDP